MAFSRIKRYEERKLRSRLILTIIGSIAIVGFLLVFGLKILVGFSLFVDTIRGTTPASQQQSALILPPVLDPLPVATNSATLTVSGSATPGLILLVYVNEEETKKLTVPADGRFSVPSLRVIDGANTISAKATDEKQNMSDLSNVLTVTIKRSPPALEVTSPASNATITGDQNKVDVSGKAEEESSVTVNDRFVVVHADGSFSYSYPLNEGDNVLKIVATDAAGNQTIVERKVTYKK